MLDPRADKRPSAAALVGGPAGTEVRRRVVRRRRRRWPLWAVAGGLATSTLVAAMIVSSRETGEAGSTTTREPSTTAGCVDLPNQPCGAALPAAGTDGRTCLVGFEDYDEDAGNGCEAAADGLEDGMLFPADSDPIEGTIVPRDDVDTFAMAVGDGAQLLCDGRFTVQITAPEGMTLRLEVLDGDEVLGVTISAGGVAGTVTIREQECLFSEARTLTARVSPSGSDRTGGAYRLERSGSF
jgi:hypothetical protein